MLQLIYISSVCDGADVAAILKSSRRNNASVEITGLLYHDGRRFLQALEGEETAVRTTFYRIAADSRHRAIVVLSQRETAVREFGHWQMAECTSPSDRAGLLRRVEPLLAGASPSVRGTFEGLMKLERTV